MLNPSVADQLEALITDLLSGHGASTSEPELQQLLAVAAELQNLPSPDFKMRLKAELLEEAEGISQFPGHATPIKQAQLLGINRVANSQVLPTFLRDGYGSYPVHRSSFAASAILHAAALALLVTVSIFAARPHDTPKVSSSLMTDISAYLPPADDRAGGGGGGGDKDPLSASKGAPPRFATDQIVPPAIIVRTEKPRLSAETTVVGPPSISFPQANQTGNPLSAVLSPLSNGPGTGGGMGNGSYGGVGPGRGPGVGPGFGGGYGGGPYLVGGGVTRPRAIYDPEPEYSEEARKAKQQGVVVLRVVIGKEGHPQDIRVLRALGMGLDDKAIEAVRQWRFDPARKDGQPVAVLVNIEVNFRLY